MLSFLFWIWAVPLMVMLICVAWLWQLGVLVGAMVQG